ncbi:MAG TPA: PKD domain-containing protein, partial [Thermoanaerobaculia bacterium]
TLASGATLRKAEDVEISGNPQQGGGASSFDFSWTPSAPQPGQSVTFKALIGGSAPAGAVIKWTIEGVKTTGATVTHTFAAAGSYEVEAELEQEGGAGTLQATHEVQVGGGTQPPGNGATAIDFSWSPSSPKAGDSVSFNASVTGTPVAGSSIKWRMPDGSRPTGSNVSFTFATAGSFSVEVEMEQPGKSNIQRQRTVTVAAK